MTMLFLILHSARTVNNLNLIFIDARRIFGAQKLPVHNDN